ncbi:hypothetical protein B5F40_15730 [Gordonibacter sp. An230]|uniref:hypothetical protein n=1 Tax=Gordonibacter sp. An230 TaxID=1965592 RepID=UPI000B367DD6|nr:hypothetical protein [Gordonibacter sp. An230]OUO85521.1 hypothetical protein B5F40_15730 [Gordonibacter sp. An230]
MSSYSRLSELTNPFPVSPAAADAHARRGGRRAALSEDLAGRVAGLVEGGRGKQEKLAAQKAWVRSAASGLGMDLTCQACAEGGI